MTTPRGSTWNYYAPDIKLPTNVNSITQVYALFESSSTKNVGYYNQNGSTEDSSINQTGLNTGGKLVTPTWPSTVANHYNNNDTSNFEGWSLLYDKNGATTPVNLIDNKYYVKANSTIPSWATGTELWDLFVYTFGVTTASSNLPAIWTAWQNIILVPTVGEKQSAPQFGVIYDKGSSTSGTTT